METITSIVENWLEPMVVFFGATALYFGGFQRDVQGGSGFRQFLGVVLTLVVFLVVWGVVHKVVGPDSVKGILVASAVAGLAIPLEARLGFLIVGARVRRASAH